MAKTLHTDGTMTDRESPPPKVAKLLPGDLLHSGPPNIADEKIRTSIATRLQEADAIMHKFQRNRGATNQDGELNPSGKRRRPGELAKALKALIEKAEAIGKTYAGAIADVESRVQKSPLNIYGQPKRSEAEQQLKYLREKELRESLRGKDPVELQADYLSASASGQNDLLLSAIENSAVPMLPDAILTQGKQIRLEQRDPESAQRLSDLTTARDYLVTMLEGLKTRLASECELMLRAVTAGQGSQSANSSNESPDAA